MAGRLGDVQGDVQISQPVGRRGANPAPALPKTLAAGMGTKNFIAEIVNIFAGLDRDRKQQLINYANQLAEAERAEKSLLAL